MAELYTYAVARIRAKEASLLTKQDLEQLLLAKSYDEAVRYLYDKGFDGGGEHSDYNGILTGENDKIWALLRELKIDEDALSVFLYKKDFHNLKSAIKSTVTGVKNEKIYLKGGSISPEIIEKAIAEKDYSSLPENMQKAAQNAMTVLLQTGDGQMCDIIIDKAALEAIKAAGKAAKDSMISDYAEITVALSDIKIAARGNALLKSAAFMKDAMAECETVDIERLSSSAAKSKEDLFEYLSTTSYGGAALALKVSYSEFEKWCDNLIMDKISAQKSNPFTIAPVAAYVLARENEINAVRIILSGIQNGLSDEFIRERLREMYV